MLKIQPVMMAGLWYNILHKFLLCYVVVKRIMLFAGSES
jgi:hypothetical protein